MRWDGTGSISGVNPSIAMIRELSLSCLAVLSLSVPSFYQDAEEGPPYPAIIEPALDFAEWGKAVDPEGDCAFKVEKGKLVINVPASPQPRDLAAEIRRVNAPRVVMPVKGDFVIQIKTDGRYVPGDESTQPGRTGYNGAAIILMSNTDNVVTLARAVLHGRGGIAKPYANFEMREQGKLHRMGNTGDQELPAEGPVYLRMERKGGSEILGSISLDGKDWKALAPKKLGDEWPYELYIGIAAITTSRDVFAPEFSELKVQKE